MLRPEFDPQARPTGYAGTKNRGRTRHLVTVRDSSGAVIASVFRYDDPGPVTATVETTEF